MAKILLTGSTGYIGRRLEQALRERQGISLRLLVRNAKKLTTKTCQQAEVIEGDSFDTQVLARALEGIDTAYYLIHSMGSDHDFGHLDRISAENFINAAIAAGVKKIIYLGGLGLHGTASKHLASRLETGEILASRPDQIRTLWFRAGVIIGSGSTSFEIVRHLVEKLPVMITPRWVKTLTQPIGVDDVIAYLTAALDLDPADNLVIDIGAPAMSFLQMLHQTAEAMGLRRWILPVPLLSPRLSSYWLTLLTPVPFRIGAALVEGLKSETLAQNDHAKRYFPEIEPASFRDSVRKAVRELEHDLVVSRWCDSSAGAVCDIMEKTTPMDSVFRDVRTRSFAGIPVQRVFSSVVGLGGEKGWFAYNTLW